MTVAGLAEANGIENAPAGGLGPTGDDLTREAIEAYRVDLSKSGSINVNVADQYAPLFQAGAEGFDVPILDGDRLIGTLAVEYREIYMSRLKKLNILTW